MLVRGRAGTSIAAGSTHANARITRTRVVLARNLIDSAASTPVEVDDGGSTHANTCIANRRVALARNLIDIAASTPAWVVYPANLPTAPSATPSDTAVATPSATAATCC